MPLQDGPREEEQLSLPVAQRLLGEIGVQPAVVSDCVPEAEARERRLDGGVPGGGCRAEGVEVLPHRPGKDKLVLGDGNEGRPQGQEGQGVDGPPIDRYSPGGQRQEAQKGE